MFCGKCGKTLSKDAEFCMSCGSPIKKEDDLQAEKMIISPDNSASNTLKKASLFLKIKRYAIIAVIIVALVALAIIIFKISGWLNGAPIEVESNISIDIAALEEQILSIGELATIEYYYQTVIMYEDSHAILGWDIPFTQKSFIIVIDGRMKIGIDTSDINVKASEQTQSISITLPNAKILSHELLEDTMVVMDESSGLFNPISIEDWSTMAVEQKQSMSEKVNESDLFKRAEDDAVRMIQALIESVAPDEYTITVSIK